jgi:hypothetical protein
VLEGSGFIFVEKGCSSGTQPVVVLCASLWLPCLAGDNWDGEVGDGTTSTPVTTPTAVIGSASGWAAISAGYFHSLGIG